MTFTEIGLRKTSDLLSSNRLSDRRRSLTQISLDRRIRETNNDHCDWCMSTKMNNIRGKNRKKQGEGDDGSLIDELRNSFVRYSSSIDRFSPSRRSLFGRNEPFWSYLIAFLVSLSLYSCRMNVINEVLLVWNRWLERWVERTNISFQERENPSNVSCDKTEEQKDFVEVLVFKRFSTENSLLVLPIPVHRASVANELKDSSNPLTTFDLHVR